ncbi:MAG: hypothetical protein EBS42_06675 [Caulobacteraceae bacterium]|nr:hypothetical protein [Caulobacteraceae bacterium]
MVNSAVVQTVLHSIYEVDEGQSPNKTKIILVIPDSICKKREVDTMNIRSILMVTSAAAIASAFAVGSVAAQSNAPAPSFTKTCQELQNQGVTVTNHVITRNSGAPTPRAGSYSLGAGPTHTYHVSPLRAYGFTGSDRWFQDSFPLQPVTGKRTCSIQVKVKGASGNVVNNDSLAVLLPTGPGKLFTPGTGWANAYRVWNVTLTDNLGNWTKTATTMKKDNSSPALSSALLTTSTGINMFDVVSQDDSKITQVQVTYRVY